MAVYYIDADSGLDANAGTSTGAAWKTLNQFTTVSVRTAGDIAILRNGTTAGYHSGDLALQFDEDGTLLAPIEVKMDYANAFGDDVDISATASATVTFGSKTWTFTSDVSGVIAADDFIYVVGDDGEVYSYRVESVSTVTVTTYLPYKGDSAGSGLTVTNIGAAPIYGTLTGLTTNVKPVSDSYWKIKGLHIQHNNGSNGCIEPNACVDFLFYDCILEGGANTTYGIYYTGTSSGIILRKCYSHNNISTYYFYKVLKFWDGYFTASSYHIYWIRSWGAAEFFECEFDGTGQVIDGGVYFSNLKFRNCTFSTTDAFLQDSGSSVAAEFYAVEDFDNVKGDTRVYTLLDSAADDIIMQSETTTVRTGGSNISQKVFPKINMGAIEQSVLKLIDLPIYANTTSKTYTFYFKPDDTAEWTTDPTASELWVELEAWGHATNNFRKITKSTGVVDFNGTSGWQSISVTVAPSQAGVAYLRVYYSKPKESGKTNVFYFDTLPVRS